MCGQIVRGKENKAVKFGSKVHKIQVGGISIIEYVSYNAFNDCKRLKISVAKHKMLFVRCSHLVGDAIYATDENSRFVTNEKIVTNFVKMEGEKTTNLPGKLKLYRTKKSQHVQWVASAIKRSNTLSAKLRLESLKPNSFGYILV